MASDGYRRGYVSFAHFCYISDRKRQYEPRHEKANLLVFDQVRHKPGCTVTEDG